MKNKLTLYIEQDTISRAKHRAIDERVSLSQLIENLLEQYLGGTK